MKRTKKFCTHPEKRQNLRVTAGMRDFGGIGKVAEVAPYYSRAKGGRFCASGTASSMQIDAGTKPPDSDQPRSRDFKADQA